MTSKTTRRDILAMTGGAVGGFGLLNSPFGMLLEALTSGLISTANAQATGTKPRKWVDFRLDGAPPRWVFDLFLKPYSANCPYVENGHVGTKYVLNGQNVAVDVEYATIARKGLLVPWVWQFNVPKAGGGTRPMVSLLDNLLHVRGVNVANPAHGGAQQLHYRPLGAAQTINALSADGSDAPIPAVYSAVGNFEFGSLASKSPVRLTAANLIFEMLQAFLSSNSTGYKQKSDAIKSFLTSANNAFAANAKATSPRLEVGSIAQKSAYDLFQTSFGNLTTIWSDLLAKYNDLVIRAFDPTFAMAGINDNPIGTSGTRSEHYRHNDLIITSPDLRSMIQTSANPTMGVQLARAFALAEFVVLNDLSDSVTVGLGTVNRLSRMINNATNAAIIDHNNDEHFTGKMPSLLINTYWARAQAACLLEFFDRLKAANKFNETIVNINPEFNRRPRDSGIGADHAQDGASFAFYSGAITGPIVVGNIRTELQNQNEYKGTFGVGAPIATMGGLTMDLASIGASIATMLRTNSPVTARSTFLREVDGKIQSKIEQAKNIG